MNWRKRSDKEPPKDVVIVGWSPKGIAPVLHLWSDRMNDWHPSIFTHWLPLPPLPDERGEK